MTVPERSLNADPDRLFNYAAANDDHAERRHAQLESRDETVLFVAGGTTGLATTVQDFRDLAVAYRAHGRHKLAAELHSAVRIVFRTGVPSAPLPEDPAPIIVTPTAEFALGTQAACNALSGPIQHYMTQVYGTGGWNGLGPLEGISFWVGEPVGEVKLRHRTTLFFRYEFVTLPADIPRSGAVGRDEVR